MSKPILAAIWDELTPKQRQQIGKVLFTSVPAMLSFRLISDAITNCIHTADHETKVAIQQACERRGIKLIYYPGTDRIEAVLSKDVDNLDVYP